MIISMKLHATREEIDEVTAIVKHFGYKVHSIEGEERVVIGVVGVGDVTPCLESVESLPQVDSVVRISAPYKFVSKEFRKGKTRIRVNGIEIGGEEFVVIAGPCSVESEEQIVGLARKLKAMGASGLRGGAFKPRTSPYSFQGMGTDGLKLLKAAGEHFGMPVVTEVMDPRQVELVDRYADMLQVGARNMQNFDLLREVGQTRKPVLLKRGMSATVKDLLMSAEYILNEGNAQVVLCERGVRTFEDSTRNMLDMSAVPNVKGQSHLPIIVDPSHATGRPDLIPAMARAAVAAGADGVHIEVHSCPERALSDGPQALLPPQFAAVMRDMRRLAEGLGETIA